MKLKSATDPLRVRIEGELSIYRAQELRDEFLSHPQLEPGGEIELDLSAVSELDGAGLQLLVAMKKEAQKRQCGLRLSGHSPAVLEALDLCDLGGYFGDPLVLSS
jgi:anti-anti-sigma factor